MLARGGMVGWRTLRARVSSATEPESLARAHSTTNASFLSDLTSCNWWNVPRNIMNRGKSSGNIVSVADCSVISNVGTICSGRNVETSAWERIPVRAASKPNSSAVYTRRRRWLVPRPLQNFFTLRFIRVECKRNTLRALINRNATATSPLQAGNAWLTAKHYKVFLMQAKCRSIKKKSTHRFFAVPALSREVTVAFRFINECTVWRKYRYLDKESQNSGFHLVTETYADSQMAW
jgi:hypothetical protein